MEGRGNVVTMRDVTRDGDTPVEQSNTKEEIREGASS